jgi:hypothetical protein
MVGAGFWRKAKSFICEGSSRSIMMQIRRPGAGSKVPRRSLERLKAGKVRRAACSEIVLMVVG